MISLFESLLDDFEDMEVSQDKEMIKQWCEDNLKGDYKLVVLKNGHIKLRGDVIIKGYSENSFPYTISAMNGNLSIEKCPNITSLNGLFVDLISIDGNFSINNCEKLTSLEGGPLTVKGTLSITGNKSLKSIEGAPELVFGGIYIMKNGKKFSVDKLKEKYGVARKIVCSIENEDELINEELINEALNEPHLLEIVDQLKKSKTDPAILFRHFDIEWDLIDSSNVQEFTRIDTKAKTKIRNTIARRDDIRGIILLWDDHKQKYTSIISDKKEILDLNNGRVYSFGSFTRNWVGLSTTELMNYVDYADSAIIINWTIDELTAKYRKQVNRKKSREGMVHNTPEYYEELARENIARYRKIVEQNKAARKAGDFDAIDKDIETIVSAAFKYVQNIRKNFKPNPNNPHNHYFETSKIENIMSEIYDKKTWVGFKASSFTVKDGYSGNDGLLSLYDQYMRLYIRVSATGDSMDSKKLNSLKTLLDDKIKVLKKLLNL